MICELERSRHKHEEGLLVVSRSAWENGNSEGNTLSNLFDRYPGRIHHLSFRAQLPSNSICETHFSIPDLDAFKTIFKPSWNCGRVITPGSDRRAERVEGAVYSRLKIMRFRSLLFARECLWKISRWQSPSLLEFLAESNPTRVFLSVSDSVYVIRVARWVARSLNIPLSLYIQDAVCDFRGFSPFMLLHQMWLRRELRAAAAIAKNVFYITEPMRDEYSRLLRHHDGRILRKTVGDPLPKVAIERRRQQVTLVYAGNLGLGRFEVLLKVAQALDRVAEEGREAVLEIYSATPLSRKQRAQLSGLKNTRFGGRLPAESVGTTIDSADIVLHVESWLRKYTRATRLSFSTKLVDYFQAGKCILAVGDPNLASIRYLSENDAALVAASPEVISDVLRQILTSRSLVAEYSHKSRACGRRNHSIASTDEEVQRI